MKVPFLDLEAAYAELGETLERELLRVARSGWYVLGPEVEAFERQFADYCGAQYAIGVANGLDALRLSLAALGIELEETALGLEAEGIAKFIHCLLSVSFQPFVELIPFLVAVIQSFHMEGS